jgi:hypothetical protein
MNKMILTAVMIVASIASVAPASAAMQIRTNNVPFPPHSHTFPFVPEDCRSFWNSFQNELGGQPAAGLVVLETQVTFAQPVSNAVAVITGWDVEFSNNNDHDFGRQIVAAEMVEREGTKLHVCIAYGLRDFSGFWDDSFEGNIRFAVLGE